MHVLISWIGNSDLRAAASIQAARSEVIPSDCGPVLRLLQQRRFDRIHLLNDILPKPGDRDRVAPDAFVEWLKAVQHLPEDSLVLHSLAPLNNNYDRAYLITREQVEAIRRLHGPEARFALLLSPGLPAAQVALVIVAHTLFRRGEVELLNTSAERGVEQVQLSYTLSVDAVSSALSRWQEQSVAARAHPGFDQILGQSRAIDTARRMASLAAGFRGVHILLRGATGTGKERFARAVHEASPRHQGLFCPVNCAAIPGELLESQLFGHVKGAFTGAHQEHPGLVAAADGGTLFLDEIGDMAPPLQAKLLRFLQEGTYLPVGASREKKADVRVVSATHRDLDRSIRDGGFRSDLYYRLAQVVIELPPLRERGQDVRLLARHILERFYQDNGIPAPQRRQFTEEALAELQRWPWPGNVRELENAVTRLAVFAPEAAITADAVSTWLGDPSRELNRPLRQLDERGVFQHLVAALDEILERRRQKRWPDELWGRNILDGLCQSLVRGRALRLEAENCAAATRLLNTKVDDSKDPDESRLKAYGEMQAQYIDEAAVQRLRGEGHE